MSMPLRTSTPTPTPGAGTPGTPGTMWTSGTAPTAPNFTTLAERTAGSATDATNAQTVANRPDQVDANGNTLTWTKNPDGSWKQVTKYGAATQTGVNDINATTHGLYNTIGTNGALTTNGLPTVNTNLGAGNFNMDPTGNSKAIQDATYKLLAPQREIERNREVQRLKSQGLTEGSPAFQAAMTRLGQGDTDAQLKSLLAGQTEYGNAFNRGLTENNQNFNQRLGESNLQRGVRGDMFGERSTVHDSPYKDLATVNSTRASTDPHFASYATAGNPGGVDYSTAGTNQYTSDLNSWNATEAANVNRLNGLLGVAGGVAGSDLGQGLLNGLGDVGGSVWNWFKDNAGGAWDTIKGLWG